MEQLSPRCLLAGDLAISEVQLTTSNGDPIDHVVAGEQIYLRADWTVAGLAASDNYVVRFSVDGEELNSHRLFPGSGSGGTGGSGGNVNKGGRTESGRYWLRGAWFSRVGTHSVTVTVDGDDDVAETNESNNTISFTFTTVEQTTFPDKLVWPVGGEQFTDWTCCNFVNRQHAGLDISILDFHSMDEGIPVFAVAAGEVFLTKDGNFDRQFSNDNSHEGEDGNGLFISHDEGWTSVYAHMARDSITVQVGDLVTPGQLLGYVGSSGGSSEPHLHFELRHNGGVVDPFAVPEQFWQNPPVPMSAEPRYFRDYGVSNRSVLGNEPPETMDVFPLDLPSVFKLVFWNTHSHKRAGDIVSSKFVRPNGETHLNFESTTPEDTLSGFAELTLLKGNFNVAGTWHWVREVNGVEQFRVPFEIKDGPGIPSIRVGFSASEVFSDGRTTPIDFGTVDLGAAPVQKTFLIENHGYGDMVLGELSLPPGFSLVSDFPRTIPWGNVEEFTVQLDADRVGDKFGALRFTTDDPDVDVFNIFIEGAVAGQHPAEVPQISSPWPRAVGYAFGQAPVRIDDEIRLVNAGLSGFEGGSLTVELDGQQAHDRLTILEGNGIATIGNEVHFDQQKIGTVGGGVNGQPPRVDLTAAAVPAAVEALLRSFAFSNDTSAPSTRFRYVRFVLTDGAGQVSNQPTKRIVLAPFEYNRPPVAGSIGDQTTDEDLAFSLALPDSVFADVNTFDKSLEVAASKADGTELPSWLAFDPQARTFSGTPRNEDVGAIDVQLTATDLGGLTATEEFQIRIENVNDAPVVGESIPDQQTAEDAPFEFAFDYTAFVDIDANDVLVYAAALSDGSPLPSWLTFNASDRQFVGTPMNDDVGTTLIQVSATDKAQASADVEFEITVTNTNDPPSVARPIPDQLATQDEAFVFTMDEATFVDVDTNDNLELTATRVDGEPLPTWLAFDASSGEFRGTPGSEDSTDVFVRVVATDNTGQTVHDDFTLQVMNVNDPPTAIELSPISVLENSAGVVIGQVMFIDPDANDMHDISVSDDRFEVVAGALTLKADQQLDHEVEPTIDLEITVTDAGDLSHSARFVISVLDQNEFAPILTSDSFAVSENAVAGAIVGTVVATDDDTLQTVSFEQIGVSPFSIDSTSGQIRVVDSTQLDYETSEQHTIAVMLEDSGSPPRSTTAELTVIVHDINEFAPTIDNRRLSITENAPNGTSVGTVAGVDHDQNQVLSYRLVGSTPEDVLAIGSSTGEVFVTDSTVLDYEVHSEVALTIEVRDNGAPTLSTIAELVVDIQDVNEFVPIIDDQLFTIDENAVRGVTVGFVDAIDHDKLQQLSYSIQTISTTDAFTVDSVTGEIVVGAITLDHESASQHELTIGVTDNGNPARSSHATITVDVLDVNEFAPQIMQQSVAVDENVSEGTVVATEIAQDSDSSQSMSYAIIEGNGSDIFSIEESTGTLIIANATQLDYELVRQHQLLIVVTDSGTPPRSAIGTIVVNVRDVNEAPQVGAEIVDQTVSANVLFDVQLPADAFMDMDAGDSLQYAARLTDGSDLPTWLSFDPISLVFSGVASNTDVGAINIDVAATDHGTPSQSEKQTFQLAIQANPFPWSNAEEPRDVDRDESIAPIDALIVINELNNPKVSLANGKLPLPYDSANFPVDVNTDGFVSAVDALIVINHLNDSVALVPQAESVLIQGDLLKTSRSEFQEHEVVIRKSQNSFPQPRVSSSNATLLSSRTRSSRFGVAEFDESLLDEFASDVAAALLANSPLLCCDR